MDQLLRRAGLVGSRSDPLDLKARLDEVWSDVIGEQAAIWLGKLYASAEHDLDLAVTVNLPHFETHDVARLFVEDRTDGLVDGTHLVAVSRQNFVAYANTGARRRTVVGDLTYEYFLCLPFEYHADAGTSTFEHNNRGIALRRRLRGGARRVAGIILAGRARRRVGR